MQDYSSDKTDLCRAGSCANGQDATLTGVRGSSTRLATSTSWTSSSRARASTSSSRSSISCGAWATRRRHRRGDRRLRARHQGLAASNSPPTRMRPVRLVAERTAQKDKLLALQARLEQLESRLTGDIDRLREEAATAAATRAAAATGRVSAAGRPGRQRTLPRSSPIALRCLGASCLRRSDSGGLRLLRPHHVLLRAARVQPAALRHPAGGSDDRRALSALQPGDLVFFGTPAYSSHVAIYMGGGQIVHTSSLRRAGHHGRALRRRLDRRPSLSLCPPGGRSEDRLTRRLAPGHRAQITGGRHPRTSPHARPTQKRVRLSPNLTTKGSGDHDDLRGSPVRPIDDLLRDMIGRNASDLHIKAGRPPVPARRRRAGAHERAVPHAGGHEGRRRLDHDRQADPALLGAQRDRLRLFRPRPRALPRERVPPARQYQHRDATGDDQDPFVRGAAPA